MATTFTNIWRLAVLAPGDPATRNSWGAVQDLTMPLMEQGAVGQVSVSIAGLTSYTLTTANNASDQARYLAQTYTGVVSGDCTVTMPDVNRVGRARNLTTTGNVRLTTGAGRIVSIPPDGFWYFWTSDGAGNVDFVPIGALNIHALNNVVAVNNVQADNDLVALNQVIGFQGVQFSADPTFAAKLSGGVPAIGFTTGVYLAYNPPDLTINPGASGLAHILGGRSGTIPAYGYLISDPAPTGYNAGGTTATYGLQVDNRAIATEFDAVSDARLKTDVTDINAAEGERFVRATRPVTFRKKGEWGAGFLAQDILRAGFAGMVSAHDAPGLETQVSDDGLISPPNVALAVTYNHAIAYLTAALRSALDRIEVLERA